MNDLAPKPSFIDAVLSTQYDECNIAASAANTLASKLLTTANNESVFAVIGEVTTLRRLTYAKIGNVVLNGDKDDPTNPNTAELILTSDNNKPVLYGITHHDIALPIVSFEQRHNGQCSYVQFGQEMHEDNLVVTAGAPRTKYVEALRSIMALHGQPVFDKYKEETTRLIGEVYSSEADLLTDSIEDECSYSLTRVAWSLYESSDKSLINFTATEQEHDIFATNELEAVVLTQTKQIKTLIIDTLSLILSSEDKHKTPQWTCEIYNETPEDIITVYQKFFTKHDLQNCIKILDTLSEKRNISFVLVRPSHYVQQARRFRKPKTIKTAEDSLILYALEENKIGMPIARFNRGEKAGVYEGEYIHKDISSTQHTALYNMFITMQKQYAELSEEIIKNSLFSWNIPDVKNHLEAIHKIFQHFEDNMKVHEMFDAKLGPYDNTVQQILLQAKTLTSNNAKTFDCILKDRKIGKTTDDVDINVNLDKQDDHTWRITVNGRPYSLSDMQPTLIFDKTIYTTKSNVQDDTLPEILDILKQCKA